jgi:hypothetical protein
MGEHADYLIEEQEDLYFDHLAGHVAFPADHCPYCEAEYAEASGTEEEQRDD